MEFYHVKDEIPFITHSYRDIQKSTDNFIAKSIKDSSTIALPILDDLELSTCIYPTSEQKSKKININLFDLNTNKTLKKTLF